MKFYSTNNKNLKVDLKEAVTQGLAPDNGLYMPEHIPVLPKEFFDTIHTKSFRDIAFIVAQNIIGDDVPADELRRIVDHTIQFDAPVVEVDDHAYALELFHGPTLAFKDFGARFMSQLLGYFAKEQSQEIIVLVATSGDTGSAVANGFLGVKGTKVIVLYPSGKVSEIQEKQFTTLGQNVIALEVDGTFDDCQRLVKQAFLDDVLRKKYFLTSANSINIARLIPQSFYYFYAYAQVKDKNKPVVISIPSGNFGNLTGGLLAQRMGLPIERFIATTNVNDVVPEYLKTEVFTPRPSRQTISNAMDVGNPSNFVRLLDLFDKDFARLSKDIVGYAFSDDETRAAMRHIYASTDYVMDPHGAIGYLGLIKYLEERGEDITGIFLETAHPAKFKEVVDETLSRPIDIPLPLQRFLEQPKKSIPMKSDFEGFKDFLLSTL
ncbi:threonine synthase [Ohtaekwangia koreensis]|uniref:Threonine synthase n=1 Tax=Ohtaekwangia koreensis TaxID=688867 RepID=A0A1T5JZ55_9BACT|nr:threonine synthase [Ohtaekwangia koreensis]SKC56528.1 threonine synthase [Ohtaekwangia koreensis]